MYRYKASFTNDVVSPDDMLFSTLWFQFKATRFRPSRPRQSALPLEAIISKSGHEFLGDAAGDVDLPEGFSRRISCIMSHHDIYHA